MPKVADQLTCRPPFDRMMIVHKRLQAGKFPNCRQLGDELSVSTRTILRDIEFMVERLGLPIEYDSGRYGFYYSRPVKEFPSIAMTEAEMFSLLVAHKAISQYHGTPFEQPLRAAFRKLTGRLDDQSSLLAGSPEEALSFHPFAPDDADLKLFEILNRALREHRVVAFLYKNLGADKAQPRRVQPYHLACVDNRWYLVAFDLVRKSMRNFAMTRMRQMTLLAGRFKRPKDFRIEDYLKGSFGIFQAADDFEVVVDFDKWAGELVRERKWHQSQELTDLPGGGVRLRLRLNHLTEVERWVLSWGAHATVVEPEALRESFRKTAEILVERYCNPKSAMSAPSR